MRTDTIHAFSLPFGPRGATYSPDEMIERRNVLCREVRALMPVAGRLPNSRLVDRIGIKDGRHELFFDLEYTGQLSLTYSNSQNRSARALLEHDLQLLKRSVDEQQRMIFREAHDRSTGENHHLRGPSRADLSRWALMRQYQGQTLPIAFADGPMTIQFPETLPFECDGIERQINGYVVQIDALQIRLKGIGYEGKPEPAAITLGKARARFAFLPIGSEWRQAGLLCSRALFISRRIAVLVKTAIDPLNGRISHYEIGKVLNEDELS